MKKLLFLFVLAALMSCGMKKSSVARNSVSPKTETATMRNGMSAEEVRIADSLGVYKVEKMASDTFKVIKLVSSEDYNRITKTETVVKATDSMLLVGVISSRGDWLVPLKYSDVHQIDRDVFVGHSGLNFYDVEVESPDGYTELYQVVYKGKPVGKFTHACDIMPVYYNNKVVGFLKTFYSESHQEYSRYYINIKGKGWDAWLGVRSNSHPRFEYYEIKGKILTLWSGAATPEDLVAFYPEDRSIYKVDLSTGRVLEDTYVAVY